MYSSTELGYTKEAIVPCCTTEHAFQVKKKKKSRVATQFD